MNWLLDRPWVDPILVLLALFTALIVLARLFHRR